MLESEKKKKQKIREIKGCKIWTKDATRGSGKNVRW